MREKKFADHDRTQEKSHIYLCTTMYREVDYEMEQLLKSIAKLDAAQGRDKAQFESHIWFDDGTRGIPEQISISL